MDSLRQANEVRINRAKDYACVVHGSMSMQKQKMATIVGDQDPVLRCSECQNLRVRHGCVRSFSVERGQYIVSQAAELRDNLQRNILVGIETGNYAVSWSRI